MAPQRAAHPRHSCRAVSEPATPDTPLSAMPTPPEAGLRSGGSEFRGRGAAGPRSRQSHCGLVTCRVASAPVSHVARRFGGPQTLVSLSLMALAQGLTQGALEGLVGGRVPLESGL